jgi:hypothetical protein
MVNLVSLYPYRPDGRCPKILNLFLTVMNSMNMPFFKLLFLLTNNKIYSIFHDVYETSEALETFRMKQTKLNQISTRHLAHGRFPNRSINPRMRKLAFPIQYELITRRLSLSFNGIWHWNGSSRCFTLRNSLRMYGSHKDTNCAVKIQVI